MANECKGRINQFGDYVTEYVVEMGRQNDTVPRIVRTFEAKCDYMAIGIAERMIPGYIAFAVYQK